MRGDVLNVWGELFDSLWAPLSELDGVPADLFSQLYRELWPALRNPTAAEALEIASSDAILLREGFDRALSLSGAGIERSHADEAFVFGGATSHEESQVRRAAAAECVGTLIGDRDRAVRLLTITLTELAENPTRLAEARERIRDRVVNDTTRSRSALQQTRSSDIFGERVVVHFLEAAFDVCDDVGGDALSNGYFNLLGAFIEKFSLRYDLRRPCVLCPTLPGVFASLIRDLKALTARDSHLDQLMKDFEESLRDLRIDCSERRIKTCIQKQINLLEALGRTNPRVRRKTLGAISKQIGSWPHEHVRSALQALYGFACDYPGIRHAGTRENAMRAIDMRDMVAMSILLAGFTPYLSNGLDADLVYLGA